MEILTKIDVHHKKKQITKAFFSSAIEKRRSCDKNVFQFKYLRATTYLDKSKFVQFQI